MSQYTVARSATSTYRPLRTCSRHHLAGFLEAHQDTAARNASGDDIVSTGVASEEEGTAIQFVRYMLSSVFGSPRLEHSQFLRQMQDNHRLHGRGSVSTSRSLRRHPMMSTVVCAYSIQGCEARTVPGILGSGRPPHPAYVPGTRTGSLVC